MSSCKLYVLEFKGVKGECYSAFSKASSFLNNCVLSAGRGTLFDKLKEFQIEDYDHLKAYFKNTDFDDADCNWLGALVCVLLPMKDWVKACDFIWCPFISG